MVKGRHFTPETQRDGVWFAHRGMGPQQWPPQRDPHTSTGQMLTAPFKDATAAYPPTPPKLYWDKHSEKNFKNSNRFSTHDNRHIFESKGGFIGNCGELRQLGRRMMDNNSQHVCDPDGFFERLQSNLEYRSIYESSFEQQPATEQTRHRRYARVYSEGNPADKLPTTTTTWFREPDVPYKTNHKVLLSTQKPFPRHNTWKYAPKGISKCYPPYDFTPAGKPKPLQTWLLSDLKGVGEKQKA